MLYTLSIGNDIKFSVLDLLRNIGMGLVNIIYSTIDVLYEVAYKINRATPPKVYKIVFFFLCLVSSSPIINWITNITIAIKERIIPNT